MFWNTSVSRTAGGEQRARHQVGPAGEVVRVVIDDGRIAGRPARAVQADDVLLAAGEKTHGKSRRRSSFVVNGSAPISSSDLSPLRARSDDRRQRGVCGGIGGLAQRRLQAPELQGREARADRAFRVLFPSTSGPLTVGAQRRSGDEGVPRDRGAAYAASCRWQAPYFLASRSFRLAKAAPSRGRRRPCRR